MTGDLAVIGNKLLPRVKELELALTIWKDDASVMRF